MSLTDEQIKSAWDASYPALPRFHSFARAIESAAAAPLLERIAELEQQLETVRKDAGNGKLWLWKNFVNGRPEYWAFDNPFPVHMDGGDPQTLGEPCGYALFKESRNGRPDVTDEEVLRRVASAKERT